MDNNAMNIKEIFTADGHFNPKFAYKSVWDEKWRTSLIRAIAHLPAPLLRTHVTSGNDKIGYTLNFSLPALYTCSGWACKTCGKGACYALAEERYQSVVIARYENLNMAIKDPERLERELSEIIDAERKRRRNTRSKRYNCRIFVRLHESGEFFAVQYLDIWLRIAENNPDVTFYTYTKQYDSIRARAKEILATPNLTIKLSAWTGVPLPQDLLNLGFGVAYCDDGFEDRIPKSAYACPATASNPMTCEKCGYRCAEKGDVFFHLHGNGAKEYVEAMKNEKEAA